MVVEVVVDEETALIEAVLEVVVEALVVVLLDAAVTALLTVAGAE